MCFFFFLLLTHFLGAMLRGGESVFICGRMWVCVSAERSVLKCMFAPIHTVYSGLQFRVRVRFIAVKYSVTTTNCNTDCAIVQQSCN